MNEAIPASPMLVDTHAHLDGPEYADDLEQTLARAAQAGLRGIVSAGQDEETSRAALSLAARFPIIAPAVGVHPHRSGEDDLHWLEGLLRDENVVAAGEMGLDYHFDFAPRDRQRDVFARQLELAGAYNLPVIIHCREAYDDLATILARHYRRGTPAVIHCFTESYDVARRFVGEFGLILGIGGVVTFKKSQALQDAVKGLPLEQLVLETDCPYVTPEPHRGKRNEPAYLRFTGTALAQLRGLSFQEVAAATTENALRLFPKLAQRIPAI